MYTIGRKMNRFLDYDRKRKKYINPLEIEEKDRCSLSRYDTYNNNNIVSENNFEKIKFLANFCEILPKAEIQYVYGPKSYTKIKINHPAKKILLFGENHMTNPINDLNNTHLTGNPYQKLNNRNTVIFSSYIKSLLNENRKNKIYDLYLEDNLQNYGESVMFNMNKINFDECLKINKRYYCAYKNIRIHYTDPRYHFNHIYPEFLILTDINRLDRSNLNFINRIQTRNDIYVFQDLCDDFLKNLRYIDENTPELLNDFFKFIHKRLIYNPYKQQILIFFNRQIDILRLKNNNLLDKLYTGINGEDNDDDEVLSSDDDDYKSIDPIIHIALYKKKRNLQEALYAILMDIYLISKICSLRGKNIIVYAGQSHVKRYLEFFKFLYETDSTRMTIESSDMENQINYVEIKPRPERQPSGRLSPTRDR